MATSGPARGLALAMALACAGCGGGASSEVPGAPGGTSPAKPAAPEKLLKSFVQLAGFDFEMDDEGKPKKPDQIPADVKALDGARADVPGYMMALDFEGGGTTRFLLMRDNGTCCFGGFAQITDWVLVTLPPEKASKIVRGTPIRVRGTLHVGEGYAPEGFLHSIYQLEASDVLHEKPGGKGKSVLMDRPAAGG